MGGWKSGKVIFIMHKSVSTVKLIIKTSLSCLFVKILRSVFLILFEAKNFEIFFLKTVFHNYRGDEFRTDYGRLAELRSVLPNANMLALTATASPSTRTSIMKKLCMEKANVVVGNCDRKNIILNCVKAPNMKILLSLG